MTFARGTLMVKLARDRAHFSSPQFAFLSWLLPLGLYALSAVFFAIRRAVECRRGEYTLLLPLLFLWIHIAYGAGFLWRVLRGGWRR